jgi:capsular polysaccharide biosynthesis protein
MQTTPLIIRSLIFSVIVAVFAAGVAFVLPSTYQATLSFTVTRTAGQVTEDYQFDGFYAIQAAELYAKNVMSWLITPAVVRQMHEAAEMPITEAEAITIARKWRPKQLSAQVVNVAITGDDEMALRQLAMGVIAVIEERAALSSDLIGTSRYIVEGEDPIVIDASTSPLVAGLVAGIAALIIALGGAFSLRYLQTSEV